MKLGTFFVGEFEEKPKDDTLKIYLAPLPLQSFYTTESPPKSL